MAKKALLTLGLAIVAATAAVVASDAPYRVLREQRERTKRQLSEMRANEMKREQLVQEQARYSSFVGRSELARSRGWLPKGEQLLDP